MRLKLFSTYALAALICLTGCSTTTAKPAEPPASEPSQSADTLTPSEEPIATGDQGTFSNPFPWGTQLTNGEIDLNIGDVEIGVDRIVASANSFNDPAPKGQIYVRVPVTVKNVGTEKVTPSWDVRLALVAATGESFEYASVSSGSGKTDPKDLSDLNDLYPGGQGQGYIYFTVPKAKLIGAKFAVKLGYGDEVFIYLNKG